MNKKELIEILKKCKAIKFGRFVLTSGEVSDYYVDIKKASTKPKILKKIAEKIAEYTEGYDFIAGMELGAVPLIVALSLETKIPYVIIRKDKREHGTKKQIEGEDIKNKRILIVEDVTTSGKSVIKTINAIRREKGLVDEVIVIVDRESGAEEKIKEMDVNFIPILSASDFLKNS